MKYSKPTILTIVGLLLAAFSWYEWHITRIDYSREVDYVAPEQQKSTATFLAVGDIMLSRDVAATMIKANKDASLPFRGVEGLLKSTDFNFGNLESPYSGKDDFVSKNGFTFNAPTWTRSGLVDANFKILNLANNHALDQGAAAVPFTRQYLAEVSIKTIGTGKNLGEAWQGDTISVNGITIGFVGASYASENDGGAAKNNFVARIEDTDHLKQAITAMKAKSDFIVVTMHAGTEYKRTPDQNQIDFAHASIDAGADIVIGAHPHWIQTIEQYRGKYIFYSLGNFIFDQEFSRDTKEGLTLTITVEQDSPASAHLQRIELIPVIIEHFSTPRLATDEETQSILKKIGVTTKVITP